MAATAEHQRGTPPPPPVIRKAGRYTIFITPPATPSLPPENPLSHSTLAPSPKPGPVNSSPLPGKIAVPAVPPVQVPPPHFKKPDAEGARLFGFFWDAVAKVQNAHSSLDGYLAEWLGLNQSRYQWALDDYYENSGSSKSKDGGKPKEQLSRKDETV